MKFSIWFRLHFAVLIAWAVIFVVFFFKGRVDRRKDEVGQQLVCVFSIAVGEHAEKFARWLRVSFERHHHATTGSRLIVLNESFVDWDVAVGSNQMSERRVNKLRVKALKTRLWALKNERFARRCGGPTQPLLFVDADTVVMGPLDPLIDYLRRTSAPMAMFRDFGNSQSFPWHTACILFGPGSEPVCDRWREALVSGDHSSDQAALQAVAPAAWPAGGLAPRPDLYNFVDGHSLSAPPLLLHTSRFRLQNVHQFDIDLDLLVDRVVPGGVRSDVQQYRDTIRPAAFVTAALGNDSWHAFSRFLAKSWPALAPPLIVLVDGEHDAGPRNNIQFVDATRWLRQAAAAATGARQHGRRTPEEMVRLQRKWLKTVLLDVVKLVSLDVDFVIWVDSDMTVGTGDGVWPVVRACDSRAPLSLFADSGATALPFHTGIICVNRATAKTAAKQLLTRWGQCILRGPTKSDQKCLRDVAEHDAIHIIPESDDKARRLFQFYEPETE